jgi:ribonuclease HI
MVSPWLGGPVGILAGMSEQPAGPVAYTDGGCVGNPGPGGWGVHVEYPDGRVIELGGAELQTTNNRMELRAAIEAARAVSGWPAATIIADSQYVLRGITAWVAGWRRKGWKTAAGQPVLNQDLWEELDAVATDGITWEWAKGHSGVPGNERCDEIASWFAASVRPLDGRRRGPVRAPSLSPAVANGAATARRAAPAGTSYISLVDGIPGRHATWSECEQRVKGVKAARFKKVRSPAEEQEVFASWGVTADDLFGI